MNYTQEDERFIRNIKKNLTEHTIANITFQMDT